MHARALSVVIAVALTGCNGSPETESAASLPSPPPQPGRHFPVAELTIRELQDAMASGRVTSEQMVSSYVDRIAAYDRSGPALHTLIRLNPRAREEAAALDRERKEKGPRGLLHGIPIVLKDNYDTRDMPTTAGSISLAGALPNSDGFVVTK